MIDLALIGHFVTWAILITILFFLRGLGSPQLPKAPKPPKPFTCPHGNISTQTPYIVNGQKRVLCGYCRKKELEIMNEGGAEDDVKDSLPRL